MAADDRSLTAAGPLLGSSRGTSASVSPTRPVGRGAGAGGAPARLRARRVAALLAAAALALLAMAASRGRRPRAAGAALARLLAPPAAPLAAPSTWHAVATTPPDAPRARRKMPQAYIQRFTNVRLRGGVLEVYVAANDTALVAALGGDLARPPPPFSVEIITGRVFTGRDSKAAAAPGPKRPAAPPTELFVAGTGHKRSLRDPTLRVRYVPHDGAAPPACSERVDGAAVVLAVRHANNWWHVVHEGLLAPFQALRELGHLPLVKTDGGGGAVEVTTGMGGPDCPPAYDGVAERAAPLPGCAPRAGRVPPGAGSAPAGVRAVPAPPGAAPTVLLFHADELGKAVRANGAQSHIMLAAVAPRVLGWEAANAGDGTCFAELLVGRAFALDLYFRMPEESIAPRAEATAAFTALATTALRDATAAGELRRSRFAYADERAERLRRGVGPEDGPQALDVLGEQPGAVAAGYMAEPELADLRALLRKGERQVLAAATAAVSDDTAPAASASARRPAGEERPVLTWMRRPIFRRAVLNERQLLAYVLSRHNVTVRVTTFEEPLLDAAEALGSTDVLAGMHGAGWSNAFLLRRGAAALQLFPLGWARPVGPRGRERDAPFMTVRGSYFRELVRATESKDQLWVASQPEHAFFLRGGRRGGPAAAAAAASGADFKVHPRLEDRPPEPMAGNAWEPWIYQNTFADVREVGARLDELLAGAGAAPAGERERRAWRDAAEARLAAWPANFF